MVLILIILLFFLASQIQGNRFSFFINIALKRPHPDTPQNHFHIEREESALVGIL